MGEINASGITFGKAYVITIINVLKKVREVIICDGEVFLRHPFCKVGELNDEEDWDDLVNDLLSVPEESYTVEMVPEEYARALLSGDLVDSSLISA